MNKKEILEHLVTVKPGDSVSEKGKEVIESLKSMSQKDRLETLCSIMDEPDIDLGSEIMNEVLGNYREELVALREANSRKEGNEDTSVEATSKRALEILS